jgi:hypothetical protein
VRRCALAAGMAALILSACSSGSSPSTGPSGPSRISQSPTPSGPRLASGAAFPSSCTPGRPKRGDTLAFVAAGHAWALNAHGTRLTCMFEVQNAGPFLWGPLGDRALLGSFEVKGLPGALTLGPSDLQAGPTSWGRPTGKSIVLVSADASALEKVHLDGGPNENLSPLGKTKYLNVTYHPSGLALAFSVERGGGQSIWMSSNTGANPRRLIFSKGGTTFGALAFADDGIGFYYEALHAGGASVLHELSLDKPNELRALWSAPPGQRIMDIRPGPVRGSLAWTAGSSCDHSVATLQDAGGNKLTVSNGAGATHALGWLDDRRVLVATGGCSGPYDLKAVDVTSGSAVPLVFGVDAAGVRTLAPTPPPPLPKTDASLGSGNA